MVEIVPTRDTRADGPRLDPFQPCESPRADLDRSERERTGTKSAHEVGTRESVSPFPIRASESEPDDFDDDAPRTFRSLSQLLVRR